MVWGFSMPEFYTQCPRIRENSLPWTTLYGQKIVNSRALQEERGMRLILKSVKMAKILVAIQPQMQMRPIIIWDSYCK